MVPGFSPAQGITSQLAMMDGLEPDARPVRLRNSGLEIDRSDLVQLPARGERQRQGWLGS